MSILDNLIDRRDKATKYKSIKKLNNTIGNLEKNKKRKSLNENLKSTYYKNGDLNIKTSNKEPAQGVGKNLSPLISNLGGINNGFRNAMSFQVKNKNSFQGKYHYTIASGTSKLQKSEIPRNKLNYDNSFKKVTVKLCLGCIILVLS